MKLTASRDWGGRSDAGRARAIVSKRFDAAARDAGAAADALEKTGDALRHYIRGLCTKNVAHSLLRQTAMVFLMKRAAGLGITLTGEALKAACAVPHNTIKAEAVFRKVDTFRHDRKRYEDNRPRILRTRAGLQPMDIVVGDVHPIDIEIMREDGTTGHPRAIAWLDLATNRVWADVVLLEKGKGIRNADVIRSFIAMVDAWGMPSGLYLDNGGEYNWAAFIDDALKLVRESFGERGDVGPWAARRSQIIRANPYNAPAKPIEGIFRVLEYNYLSLLTGHVGGDRMRKKTQTVGREPVPYNGSFNALQSDIRSLVAVYANSPQTGVLKGKSPNQAFDEHAAADWKPITVAEHVLPLAFTVESKRAWQKGRVSVNGQWWTRRDMQRCQDDRVTVYIPKYEDWRVLPWRDSSGTVFFAEPERAYGFLDPAGAVEAAERAKAHRHGALDLEKRAPKIDALAELLNAGKVLAFPVQSPPIMAGHLSLSPDGAELGKRLNETPDDKLERRRRESDAQRAFLKKRAARMSKQSNGSEP